MATPDLDRIVNNYAPENADKYHYNESILGRVLRAIAGLRLYTAVSVRRASAPMWLTLDNRSDSLFMEAVKRASEPD